MKLIHTQKSILKTQFLYKLYINDDDDKININHNNKIYKQFSVIRTRSKKQNKYCKTTNIYKGYIEHMYMYGNLKKNISHIISYVNVRYILLKYVKFQYKNIYIHQPSSMKLY